jgi:hypothetical protein
MSYTYSITTDLNGIPPNFTLLYNNITSSIATPLTSITKDDDDHFTLLFESSLSSPDISTLNNILLLIQRADTHENNAIPMAEIKALGNYISTSTLYLNPSATDIPIGPYMTWTLTTNNNKLPMDIFAGSTGQIMYIPPDSSNYANITANITFSSSVANKIYIFSLFKNNTIIPNSLYQHRTTSTIAQTITFNKITELTTDDIIQIYVQDSTGTSTITFYNIVLNIVVSH